MPKLEPDFPPAYVVFVVRVCAMIFGVCFVGIGEIVYHHCFILSLQKKCKNGEYYNNTTHWSTFHSPGTIEAKSTSSLLVYTCLGY